MTTYREFFNTTDDVCALMRLVGMAHSGGRLTRRRLVQVAVRCCEVVAWQLHPESRVVLAEIAAWAHGVGGAKVRAITEEKLPDFVVIAARITATVPENASAEDSAVVVAAYAASAAGHGAGAALCDVVRDEIDVEEVCRALNVNPEELS